MLALVVLAFAGPDRATAHADGFFRDGYGRVRIFRGFNDIQRSKGFDAGKWEDFLPKVVVNETLLDVLEENGFNGHRIPMMWAPARPAPNETGTAYLAAVQAVVKTMAEHHQYALLDMHQDVGCDPGAGGYAGLPLWLVNRTQPKHAYPWPQKLPFKDWGQGYLAEATGQCFQELYENTHGGLDAWADFWTAVAQVFKAEDTVLGYELMNEPWAGNTVEDPLLYVPGVAGHKNLQPAYQRLAKQIRATDKETTLFFEPVTWGMILNGEVGGSGFTEAPDANSALAYHYYCWFAAGGNHSKAYPALAKVACDDALGPAVFSAVQADSKQLQVPSMLTEWGGVHPEASLPKSEGTEELRFVMSEADKHFTSWTFYDFCSLMSHEGESDAAFDLDALKVFARPFAQAVQGTPTKMEVAPDGTFTLEFAAEPSIPAPTEIATPPLHFPHGFDVSLSPGLRAAPAPGRRNVLAVTADRGTAGTVVLRPKAQSLVV